MSSTADTFFDWERFPSALKHEIVGGYLTDAFPVLLQHFGTDVVYADLFAGPGRSQDGKRGSPLIAADLAVDWAMTGASTRVHCFNVEANPVYFNELQANTSQYPAGLVTNRQGTWQAHLPELDALMRGLPAIIFMDPFRLDISLDAIEDLVRQIGSEPRDLILMLNVHGLQRVVNAKAAEDLRRGESAELGGSPSMPSGNYYQRPNAVLGGRWWQEVLIDGRLLDSSFGRIVEGYCDQLRRIGGKDGKAVRRALAVPIPYRLGGSTSYYLVLVTRSPKAVVLFSDAADMAISEAWRAREEQERLRQRPPDAFIRLFEDQALPPAHESTHEARRQPLLRAMTDEVLDHVERLSWPPTLRDLHETLAVRHCGQFRLSHLAQIIRNLRDDGYLTTTPDRLGPRTRIARTAKARTALA